MAKYLDSAALTEMNEARLQIFAIRAEIYRNYQIDVLDTDALSALSIHEIVSQYDSDYNINFSRNGEDAISNGVLIEQKAARVAGALTKTGKPRKNADADAGFQFHAMGDIEHDRYIFVARKKDDLSVIRMYDISTKSNCQIIINHLKQERANWLAKGQKNTAQMKRDIISISEKFIKEKLNLSAPTIISGCAVYKD